MEEKQKRILQWVFLGIMAVGLVLILVGMFLNVVQSDKLNLTFKLVGDEKWALNEQMLPIVNAKFKEAGESMQMSAYEVSGTFTIISFVIAIVGVALLILNSVLKNVLHKKIKVLGVGGILVTLFGAVMIIIAGIMLASNLDYLYWHYMTAPELWGNNHDALFSASAGIYVGLVGGILAALAGIASMLKPFKN